MYITFYHYFKSNEKCWHQIENFPFDMRRGVWIGSLSNHDDDAGYDAK